ncbi:MAG TPA: efflux RND transporter periplasmic adaptor subunit, partial [Pirellulales bacterium]|nr:efflux RND transporter periplasmic adaptor subunit [Pirellulales bacterium]
ITGYVRKWHVDIGDPVRNGDLLAELSVPDVVAEFKQKEAEAQQAKQMYEVSKRHVVSSAALVEEAQAGLLRAKANLSFEKSQFARFSKLDASVIETQVKEESWSQVQSKAADVQEADAKVAYAEAALAESEAARDKSQSDIAAAEAARDKMQSLVDYARLTAPFDGVVTRRNINTGDFVQPPTRNDDDPLYVVQRSDVMRVFVEVPETESVWLRIGTPAKIQVPASPGLDLCGTVTRMAYSLKPSSRTLLAEIDLPNPEDLLRPGMYVLAEIDLSRANVLVLPTAAISNEGDVNEGYRNFCFLLGQGRLRRSLVEIGARGYAEVEVLRWRNEDVWNDFTGEEDVVTGNLLILRDGQEADLSTP